MEKTFSSVTHFWGSEKEKSSDQSSYYPLDMENSFHLTVQSHMTIHAALLGSMTVKQWLKVSDNKDSACGVGDQGSIPRLGRSSGKGNGNPLQYSCLESSWTEEPGGVQSMGAQRVGHDSVTFTHSNLYQGNLVLNPISLKHLFIYLVFGRIQFCFYCFFSFIFY